MWSACAEDYLKPTEVGAPVGPGDVRPRSGGQEFRCVHWGGVRLYSAGKETMNPHTVLWIYIVLLLVGGLIGFLKAGSKVSLITSAVSAAALVLTAIPAYSCQLGEHDRGRHHGRAAGGVCDPAGQDEEVHA